MGRPLSRLRHSRSARRSSIERRGSGPSRDDVAYLQDHCRYPVRVCHGPERRYDSVCVVLCRAILDPCSFTQHRLSRFTSSYLALYSALNWRTCATLGYCSTMSATIVEAARMNPVEAAVAVTIASLITIGLDRRLHKNARALVYNNKPGNLTREAYQFLRFMPRTED